MLGTFDVCVNAVEAFDGMKNYTPVFTCCRDALLSAQTHTCACAQTNTCACAQTNTQKDHLTGKALACYVCWHGFKVYVTVTVYLCQSLCPSCSHASLLPGNNQAKLWAQQRVLWASWQPTQACPRYVALSIISTLYAN